MKIVFLSANAFPISSPAIFFVLTEIFPNILCVEIKMTKYTQTAENAKRRGLL
jgi:hypothetical protein